MKSRFFLIILMLILLFSGWLYLNHEYANSLQAKLDELAQLPIYAYVADSTRVEEILNELKPISEIEKTVHEPAMQAAAELIDAYGLPLSEEMIADYSFPDVITITLKPISKAITAKPRILSILRSKISETDIDSQSSAYNLRLSELSLLRRQMLIFNGFAFILMLLVYVFSRLSFELHVLLYYKGKRHSVVDKIRHQKQGVEHTWTMLLIPLPLCVAVYYALVFLLPLPHQIPYWVIIGQFAAALIGTLITHFSLHTFEQEIRYSESPVEVVSHTNPSVEDELEKTDS